MTTLYRKYRPRRFEDIVGQDQVVKTLQAALTKQRLAHAYLFHGARGTGKTTTARVLADALGARGLDVIEIDAASNRGIDDIRKLREATALSPTQGSYKVYIIDEVHMLTKEAFAALLKTLEEPVKHVVFILATTELHKVPATIVSRCQVYRFRRAQPHEMKARLSGILQQEERKISPEALEFIVRRSDGCYRDAESLLGQVLTWREGVIEAQDLTDFLGLPERELLENFVGALTAGDSRKALELIETVYAQGLDSDQFVAEAIRYARDTGVELTLQGKIADKALSRLPVIIRALLQAIQDLAYVPEPKIALQLAVLSVAKEKPNPSPPPLPTGQAGLVRGGGVSRIQNLWPQVITQVKEKNPVASTFLRAMEPVSIAGSIVAIRVQYPLHRNFFDKLDNRQLLEETLSRLLGTPITARLQLDEPSAAAPGATIRQKEEELYAAAKEMFEGK